MSDEGKSGPDCKGYYGVAGSLATNLLTVLRDVTKNRSATEIDDSVRGKSKSTLQGQQDLSLDLELKYVVANTGYIALRDAYINGTAIALALLDAVGGKGVDADFVITAFNEPEPMDGLLVTNATAKVTTRNRTPVWRT